MERQKAMISFIPKAMTNVAESRGDIFFGEAKFVGPNTVEVNGEQLEGAYIVIATGSKTRPLPIPGAEYMITSDDVLSEETQPESVVFVGGGVIAMEFSHVYARAGTKVHILEAMPRLLPRVEIDAVAAIQSESERLGIEIDVDVKVKEIKKTDTNFRVIYELDGKEFSIDAARIINGAGRIANVDTLDLTAGNVAHDRIAVDVNEHLQSTTNPAVWVCGDSLVSSPQLSPVATYEGQIVGQNIVNGAKLSPDYRVLPSSIYTVPALSSVGLSEQEAEKTDKKIRVTNSDMKEWFSAKSYGETVAWAKVIIDEETDQILGAHLVGHKGEELIHLFALAMRHKISASDLKSDFYAFPTFSSDIKNLL